MEAPTYLGAISVFNPYEPEYIRMDTDDNGLLPDALERLLKDGGVKFIYLVPTFQNPNGRTLPLKRRMAIAQILKRYDALMVEDDPYGALRYRGETVPPIKTLAPENLVYVSTPPKVFAPGLRIGFYVAPELINRWLVLFKQGVDLHTSTFNQALAAEYLAQGYLDRHLPAIINIYRPKQKAMLTALETYFPREVNWSRPEGGMFIWVEGPRGLDMESLCWKAVERNVAFVPGKFFYTDPHVGIETMRPNYTMADEKTIAAAIKVLSEVIKESI